MKPFLLGTGACVLSFMVGVFAGLSTGPGPSMNHVTHAYGWMALKMVGGGPSSDLLDAARRYVDMGATATDDEWSLAYKVPRLLALTLLARDGALGAGSLEQIAEECGSVGWVDCSREHLEEQASVFVNKR